MHKFGYFDLKTMSVFCLECMGVDLDGALWARPVNYCASACSLCAEGVWIRDMGKVLSAPRDPEEMRLV